MTNKRLLTILDNLLAWGMDHDEEFRECMLAAMDLTDDEIKELDLENFVCDSDDDDYQD